MPEFLDPRDRRLVIGAGVAMVLLLALTYAVAPPARQQSIGFPSSYSSEWAGAKAAFLLLEESGYRRRAMGKIAGRVTGAVGARRSDSCRAI